MDNSRPRWGRAEGMRFHYVTQNGAQFKAYESLISEVFHFFRAMESRGDCCAEISKTPFPLGAWLCHLCFIVVIWEVE